MGTLRDGLRPGEQGVDGHAVKRRQLGDVLQAWCALPSFRELQRRPDNAGGLRSFTLREPCRLPCSHEGFRREGDVR